MTQKDYKLIASVLQSYRFGAKPHTKAVVYNIATLLADEFKHDNFKFDKEKFLEACGVNDP